MIQGTDMLISLLAEHRNAFDSETGLFRLPDAAAGMIKKAFLFDQKLQRILYRVSYAFFSFPREVPDGRALHVQRFEVTIAEWNACFDAGACAIELRARPGFDPATTPATGVNQIDAQDYLRWITATTGHPFRLPTAAEWAHMAASVLPETPDPLFTDPSLRWAMAYLAQDLPPRVLMPQGSFSTTPEGIADLDGSVWEWTQDCVTNEPDQARCPAFIVGGEHESGMFYLERYPARGGCAAGAPPAHLGLRLVADHQ